MTILAGVDIGGTKCAVCVASVAASTVRLLDKRQFPTPTGPGPVLAAVRRELEALAAEQGATVSAIGITCGGPLDSRRGLILSPPNLPNWDGIDVVTPFREQFGVPVGLQNDANACALAEWQWGAGRGCNNMIFLTFGTGMGAGLILDGRLYSGANNLAGEVGHIRLADYGPVGYGKIGSFEGFCSGGGIARLAQMYAEMELQMGRSPSFCATWDDLPGITAEKVGLAAQTGDELALKVFAVVGRQLGRGLAILVDILNPERVVIGSIYSRQRAILEPIVLQTLAEEALPMALSVCQIVPAGLGESVGDYASLAVAMDIQRGSP